MHDDDDHSDGFDLGSVEEGSSEEIEGLERFTLNSVGIDIGSSTTHVIFSRLVLQAAGCHSVGTLCGHQSRSPLPLAYYAHAVPNRDLD